MAIASHVLVVVILFFSSFCFSTLSFAPNAIVAQDGSGTCNTIQQALDEAAKRNGTGRFVIYIKAGIYREYLYLGFDMPNITMIGDGMSKTVITGDHSAHPPYGTFNCSTVVVLGAGFMAEEITFRNTAGPQNGQAVALLSNSNQSVFYRCSFEGYQDTLCVFDRIQFYRECYIYGTVDFIFGDARVVFQNCTIYVRRPLPSQYNVITAQSRYEPDMDRGIIIHQSRIVAAPDLVPVQSQFRTFLGRPWGRYSRTVYLRCYLGELIDPAGWTPWEGDFALDTLYYGEYENFGPGNSTNERVRWKGYRHIDSFAEASTFSVGKFIDGWAWLPATGVPFNPDI